MLDTPRKYWYSLNEIIVYMNILPDCPTKVKGLHEIFQALINLKSVTNKR